MARLLALAGLLRADAGRLHRILGLVYIGVASIGEATVAALLFFMSFTRVTLVFPAAACGNALDFRMAWRKMRGNTWRLIAAIVLVTVAYFSVELVLALAINGTAILSVLSGATPQITPRPAMLVFTVQLVSRFLFLALTSSVAAIFYRELVLRPADVAEVFS
ncbi:MAG: hypothetical protein ACREFI_19490 [Stellaceae bacterium]